LEKIPVQHRVVQAPAYAPAFKFRVYKQGPDIVILQIGDRKTHYPAAYLTNPAFTSHGQVRCTILISHQSRIG